MSSNQNPISCLEGSLLEYGLSPSEAGLRLNRWCGLGVPRAVLYPGLLAEIRPEDFEGMTFVGAVAFPSGGTTLSTKRMELLECVRLGAEEATVVLTPAYVLDMATAALEAEMRALLATAPELKVRFLVEGGRMDEPSLTHFARLLKSASPSALVTSSGLYPPVCGHERIRALRAKLGRKVSIVVGHDLAGPEAWDIYRECGADRFVTSRPEAFAENSP